MSFPQAVSGLGAAYSNLDVIGNNIANASTPGFRAQLTAPPPALQASYKDLHRYVKDVTVPA